MTVFPPDNTSVAFAVAYGCNIKTTLAYLWQGEGNLRGTNVGPAGIKPEQLNDAFFEYVFRKGPMPEGCTIPEKTMQEMRNEFEYW